MEETIEVTGTIDKVIGLFNNPGFTAAIVAIFSGLGTLLLGNIFGLLKAKSEENKLFFERYFPERIKVYNDVIEIFPDIFKETSQIKLLPPNGRPEKIAAVSNKISYLCYKNILWLDEDIKTILMDFSTALASYACQQGTTKLTNIISDAEFDEILILYSKYYTLITTAIKMSSGVSIINKRMNNLTKPNIFKKLFLEITGKNKKVSEQMEKFLNSGFSDTSEKLQK